MAGNHTLPRKTGRTALTETVVRPRLTFRRVLREVVYDVVHLNFSTVRTGFYGSRRLSVWLRGATVYLAGAGFVSVLLLLYQWTRFFSMF